MRRLPTLATLLFASTTLSAQEAPEAPRVTGEGDAAAAQVLVNEVNAGAYPAITLFATVTQNGAPVTGLGAADFRVREDEVEQSPLTVEEQLPALSVVVTMDVSGSMSEALTAAQEAATAFVESLPPSDSVQLVSFAREVEVLGPMSDDRAGVTEAIGALQARGDTALYDALLQSVDLVGERPGRKAIVVLSDGLDDDGAGQPLSEATVDDVLERAAEVNVPIFVVGLGAELDVAGLSAIADQSGGLFLEAPTADELSAVYGQIGAALTGQYAISYTSTLPQDGTTRRVDLEALGATGSKAFTPGGAVAAPVESAETVSSDGGACPQTDALATATPELEQAEQRYSEGLINVTENQRARTEALAPVLAAFGSEASIECVVEALTQVGTLYDGGFINVTDQSELVGLAADSLEGALLASGDADAALRRVEEIYDQGLINVTTNQRLREAILAAE